MRLLGALGAARPRVRLLGQRRAAAEQVGRLLAHDLDEREVQRRAARRARHRQAPAAAAGPAAAAAAAAASI